MSNKAVIGFIAAAIVLGVLAALAAGSPDIPGFVSAFLGAGAGSMLGFIILTRKRKPKGS